MTKKRSQRVYKMKGCSKTRKNYLGGSGDVTLAYPGNVPTVPNPFLSYTGKGGSDKTLPNQGPTSEMGTHFLNPQGAQRGGTCGCGMPLMVGGSCGPMCGMGFMVGGARHRCRCRCSKCKKRGGQKGGNPGIPYPNGLTGSPWTPNSSGWPGVDGIQGDRNYLDLNTYDTDISRQMISTGANPPFSIGGKRKRKQKGGTLSNFLAQDFINLGRQFNYGMGSAYNALAGYSAPVNPLPWKDQLPNSSNLRASTI
ncbi:hypothetical protein EBU71_20400 [bacterium]|nr:hypothetical protein [Candidatus Elulimicrobium humile]